jgi:hypothetical protein
VRSPFDSAAEHEENEMETIKEHDPALSAPTAVGVLSARPRADLEREVRTMQPECLLLRRERATA